MTQQISSLLVHKYWRDFYLLQWLTKQSPLLMLPSVLQIVMAQSIYAYLNSTIKITTYLRPKIPLKEDTLELKNWAVDGPSWELNFKKLHLLNVQVPTMN